MKGCSTYVPRMLSKRVVFSFQANDRQYSVFGRDASNHDHGRQVRTLGGAAILSAYLLKLIWPAVFVVEVLPASPSAGGTCPCVADASNDGESDRWLCAAPSDESMFAPIGERCSWVCFETGRGEAASGKGLREGQRGRAPRARLDRGQWKTAGGVCGLGRGAECQCGGSCRGLVKPGLCLTDHQLDVTMKD